MGRRRIWAVLEDGQRWEGDILVGADGIWSKVIVLHFRAESTQSFPVRQKVSLIALASMQVLEAGRLPLQKEHATQNACYFAAIMVWRCEPDGINRTAAMCRCVAS